MSKVDAILEAANNVLCGNVGMAKDIINSEYPLKHIDSTTRKYTDNEKMTQFIKDGFMDRYSGDRLLNPGLLKVLSYYMPDEFPYHPHWKMEECHNAYWEFVPTLDHVYPVALGEQMIVAIGQPHLCYIIQLRIIGLWNNFNGNCMMQEISLHGMV